MTNHPNRSQKPAFTDEEQALAIGWYAPTEARGFWFHPVMRQSAATAFIACEMSKP
jgi:hypothetical protein